MSFREDLVAKVQELRAAAERLYRHELSSDKGITVHDDGDWEPAPGNDGDDWDERVAEERPRYESFMRDLDDLAGRFEKYEDLNAVTFTSMLTMLGGRVHASTYDFTAYGLARTASDSWVTPVLGMIAEEQWTGDAAEAFQERFLLPFDKASEVQMACVRELTIAVASYKEATLCAQEVLLNIADQAIKLFDYDQPGPSLEAVFSLVSLITSAIGYVFGGRAAIDAVSLGADILSRIAGAASNQSSDDPPPLTVEGDKAREILDSTWEVLSELEGYMGDFDDTLRRGLRDGLDNGDLFDSTDIKVPRPAVADDPTLFGRLTIVAAPGVPLEDNPVVASVVDLYRAGAINLPNAADLYRQASDIVRGLSIPITPTVLYGSSRHAFDDAKVVLADVLGGTAHALEDTGTALCQIAQTYELTDDEGAEALRRIGKLVPPQTGAVGFPT